MAIAPNSTVNLLAGCPLSTGYPHTMHFANVATQTAYFSGLTILGQARYSYIRQERALLVEANPGSIATANYMMYRNTAYYNKWFYAYITQIEYVNDNTAKVYFQIDQLQTWLFEMQIMPCFVEREHPATDIIGENLIPDNLDPGEYIIRDYSLTGNLQSNCIIVAATVDANMNPVSGHDYGRIFTGLQYHKFSNSTQAANFISQVVEAVGDTGIVAVFMAPAEFYNVSQGSVPTVKQITVDANYSDIDGYKPKNNKLFTYPYNYFLISNFQGGLAEYRYEFGADRTIEFNMTCDMTCNPTAIIMPVNYKGYSGVNANEALFTSGWPQCSYTTDAFKAYLAINAASDVINYGVRPTVGAVGQMAGSIIGGALMGGAAGEAFATQGVGKSYGNLLGTLVDNALALGAKYSALDALPPQVGGNGGGSGPLFTINSLDFGLIKMTVRAEFAEIIDNYWTVYGYPCHKVKVPEIKTRPYWNYTKTVGAIVKGRIPAEASAEIQQRLDSGLTWWSRGDILGDYTLDNRPTGGARVADQQTSD